MISESRASAPSALPTGRLTLLFTDIQGSTRLLQSLGRPVYGHVLARHHQLVRQAIAEEGGIEVKTEGDAFFAVFEEPVAALKTAVRVQRAIHDEEWPADAEVAVRMGLHTGDVELAEGEYVGLDVHRAARISDAGHGGQVLLSADTRVLVSDSLSEGVALRSLGTHRLKDLAEPEELSQLLIDGLPTEFPPPRSLELTPNNLPRMPTAFFGRKRELADARRALEQSRLLTLTGPAGTGKTRLAVQLAAEMLDVFPDGLYYVPLATLREPELVLPAIARVFGVEEGDELHRRLVQAIGPRQLLLVLDNFEQVSPAAADLSALLADTPRLKILVTSRSRLDVGGEREYAVEPLATPDPRRLPAVAQLAETPSVALFVDRAQAVRPGFTLNDGNARPVAEISARLDGLPLAIELAAARTRLLSPEQICARLSDRLSLLASSRRDLNDRQRTLRGAIQWSYDLLDAAERQLFERLGVFRGGAGLTLAGRVLAIEDELELLERFGSLIDKSLLRRSTEETDEDGLRVEMLESIREFAAERLAAAGELADYRRRHARVFVEFAEQCAPELSSESGAGWLDRLECEHDNLRAAFNWAVDEGDVGLAARLCDALWRFWQMRGHLTEGRERAETALRMPAQADDRARHARLLSTAGSLAYWQADWPAARAYYGAALELEQRGGDARRIADAMYNLSFAYSVPRDDVERAMELAEEALALFRQADDKEGVAKTLWALGGIAAGFSQPRTEQALEYYDQASQLFRELGNKPMLAWANFMRAGTEVAVQRLDDARESTKQALKLFAELGDVSGYALCIHGLSVLALVAGDRREAFRLAGAAGAIARSSGVNLADSTSGRWLARLGLAEDSLDKAAIADDPELLAAWREGEALDAKQAVAEAAAS